ncbi:hypothetical protein HY967_02615, partial [Candidatus Jorgensenbacteria bacterium]|nr:hypothetical protein [Candidatus Jorgensenbacteria bacterium]
MPQFKKKLLFQSVTFSVAIGALIIGTVYFGRTISRASEEVVKNRQELLNRSTALDTLASLTHQYNSKGKKYLNVLYGLVPKRDDLFTLGQEFQSLAT